VKRLPIAAAASYAYRGLRLIEGFVRGRPVHCIVQVSNRCNLSCGFCSFWERPARREDEMSLADFEVISAKLAEAGSMIISIEGGEPLMRPDIVGIVRAFARHHHPILFTNGWRVTEELARELWAAGLSEIGVSIDYATPARHDAHRGQKGTFAAAMRAVDILRDTAPHGRRQVALMTVLMLDNADEMEDLLKISAEKGVNHQTTLISVGGDGRADTANKMLPRPGTGAKLAALKARYPHFIAFSGYIEGIDPFLEGRVAQRSTCWAGERFLNIDHMGEVSPCIEKLHLRAGNLRRDPWSVVAARLRGFDEETKGCADCFTSCKGFVEEMSGLPRRRSYAEFFGNFASPPGSRT
jgi:MoaA/NifB/PqqE/SkfB family radical SAM enzyme